MYIHHFGFNIDKTLINLYVILDIHTFNRNIFRFVNVCIHTIYFIMENGWKNISKHDDCFFSSLRHFLHYIIEIKKCILKNRDI